VVNLAKAETDPAQSVTATVDAGYQPVRVITAGNGTQVWVTARASDDLLCFSAAQLTADPARALVAVVRVGSEPVGLAAVRDGTLIVTGDLATGQFPRDMAVSPGGTLLVADYISGQVQAIATAHL
jgi:DNA-binding beta-propeller fold protein YncE